MRKQVVTMALAGASIVGLGGAALAAATSVSDTPGPQVVVPVGASSSTPTSVDDHGARGRDDPATTVTAPGVTEPETTVPRTTATTVEDRGANSGPGSVNSGPGRATTSTSTATTATTATTVDDHGANRGSGGGGSDDGSGHDAGNDHGGHGADG